MKNLQTILTESLNSVYKWYGNMILENGMFAYKYEPNLQKLVYSNVPIRNIGTIWDVAVLSNYLTKKDYNHILEKSLNSFIKNLSYQKRGTEIALFDSNFLKEDSSIAHNAFMILSLVEVSRLLEQDKTEHYGKLIHLLADGIITQQRSDGSYKIYFDYEADHGIEFYAPEAMLSLVTAYTFNGNEKYLSSVEKAFPFYIDYYDSGNVSDDLLIFFANWETQAANLLYKNTKKEKLKKQILDHIYELHNAAIHHRKFYKSTVKIPYSLATVEVACGLEGLADAYDLLLNDKDNENRRNEYKEAIIQAVNFLLRVQKSQTDPRAIGGFGHGINYQIQRLDVTGHTLCAFIKLLNVCERDETLKSISL